jgi:hypothetical protein
MACLAEGCSKPIWCYECPENKAELPKQTEKYDKNYDTKKIPKSLRGASAAVLRAYGY